MNWIIGHLVVEVDSVGTKLNYRTPSWCQRIGYLVGTPPHHPTHMELELRILFIND